LKDTKCICNNDDFIPAMSCCISQNCNADDQSSAIKFAHATCDSLIPGRLAFRAQCGNSQGAAPSSSVANSQGAAPSSSVAVVVSATSTTVAVISSVIPVTVAVPATITSVLLQTSLVTDSQLVLLTSVVTNAAAISTEVVTSSTVAVLTSVINSQVVETITSDQAIPAFATSTAFSPEFPSDPSSSQGVDSAPVSIDASENPSSTQEPLGTNPSVTSLPSVTDISSKPVASTEKKMSAGQKFGVAVAVLAAIAILAAFPLYVLRRRKQIRNQEMKEAHDAMSVRAPKAVPLYPNTGGYRDIFDRPGAAVVD
jgi:hypothetical protein